MEDVTWRMLLSEAMDQNKEDFRDIIAFRDTSYYESHGVIDWDKIWENALGASEIHSTFMVYTPNHIYHTTDYDGYREIVSHPRNPARADYESIPRALQPHRRVLPAPPISLAKSLEWPPRGISQG